MLQICITVKEYWIEQKTFYNENNIAVNITYVFALFSLHFASESQRRVTFFIYC